MFDQLPYCIKQLCVSPCCIATTSKRPHGNHHCQSKVRKPTILADFKPFNLLVQQHGNIEPTKSNTTKHILFGFIWIDSLYPCEHGGGTSGSLMPIVIGRLGKCDELIWMSWDLFLFMFALVEYNRDWFGGTSKDNLWKGLFMFLNFGGDVFKVEDGSN